MTPEPSNEPIHRDRTPPDFMPKERWAKMTQPERDAHLMWVREWFDQLADEDRDERRKQHGY